MLSKDGFNCFSLYLVIGFGASAMSIDNLDVTDPDKLCEIVKAMEPTFGGINLEDIKAPECFYIEDKLKNRRAASPLT